MERRYLLRVYGLPRVDDEEHAGERAAIERGREHLASRERGFAEVREKMTAQIVWTGYLTDMRGIKETYEREPGSDDA